MQKAAVNQISIKMKSVFLSALIYLCWLDRFRARSANLKHKSGETKHAIESILLFLLPAIMVSPATDSFLFRQTTQE